MRLYRISDVKTGMVLGKSIYDRTNKLLLGHGYSVDDEMIEKLSYRGYHYIYIMEDGTEDVIPEDIISIGVRLNAGNFLESLVEHIKKRHEFEHMEIDEAIEMLEDGALQNASISLDARNIVGDMITDISYVKQKVLKSILPKSKTAFFVDHAINTALISILIGYKYKLKRNDLLSIGVGSLLHDIGKVLVSVMNGDDINNMSEVSYQHHPRIGYHMLRNCSVLTPMESQIPYQHHEHQDGTGFPSGFTGNNSPPFKSSSGQGRGKIFRLAEICAVADAYDRTVLNPFDETELSPQESIGSLVRSAGTLYNKDIVRTMIKVVPVFPVGAYMRITRTEIPSLLGCYGIVADIHGEDISKPVIILMKDKNQKKIPPIRIETVKMKNARFELAL